MQYLLRAFGIFYFRYAFLPYIFQALHCQVKVKLHYTTCTCTCKWTEESSHFSHFDFMVITGLISCQILHVVMSPVPTLYTYM